MATSRIDDELWEQFHAAVDMTSRELGDSLREEGADERAEERGVEPEPTAGDAAWRHALMDLGHDPRKG